MSALPPRAAALRPLELLYASPDLVQAQPFPLPPTLAQLYGPLSFPRSGDGPLVIGNFVETLDGVVALGGPEHGGGEISGFNAHDRMVMGLLRAVADAVVVGAGTLRADPMHQWTASHVFPALADAYHDLRAALGKSEPPLNVFVTASGRLDIQLPVFQSGEVPVLIVTTPAGAQHLAQLALPPGVTVAASGAGDRIRAEDVLAATARAGAAGVVLVEGGPYLMGDFLDERCLDELFLTLAPQVAGRDVSNQAGERPGFVAGRLLAPQHPLWGELQSIHRGENHLFLRYAFPTTTQPEA